MRVNTPKKIFIILKIVVISIIDPLRVIFGPMFYQNKRAYTDRIIHGWARKVLHIMKVDYKVFNQYDFQFNSTRPYIIMSNHASHFDIPIIYNTFPNDSIGMIAKKELFRIPVFGWAMKIGGCISIDRVNKRQAIKDLANATNIMLSGVRIWIAPEGTRSATGKLGVFKKGGFKIAMDAKAVIVPVTIIGSNKILPTKTLDFSLNESVSIHMGKPIDTANYQRSDIKRLMVDTESAIQENL